MKTEMVLDALEMARCSRGGHHLIGLVTHSDAGSQFTSVRFTERLGEIGARPSIGTVADFDNAAAEAFFSSLEWEVLSRHDFANTRQAQAVVLDWCYGFYNHQRRHSSAAMMSPINYENTTAPDREAA